ncbi:TPR repeat protein/transcriptional regulator with XRE-family HTH domain [Streptomyces sp. B4I13]|uniref:hypothetical protein n=1 Tax=Streptomyces sp. B4I13 TaxID=3042271 RepID=UPI002783FAC2|nr:hypothetical protein [Streptomyces sp. B4I13]MDQ0956540.1 TPR repeat protein/transcriptional regulator with XRE-family HTH domain [Streptomyces sp. B4I13]
MSDERADDDQDDARGQGARSELLRRLADGLAASRLTGKAQLAELAGVGRTTVHAAFNTRGPVPSEHTVAALAAVLRLPVGKLLELRRMAADEADGSDDGRPVPGRRIDLWEPHDLEIHPAGWAGQSQRQALPRYVERAHDRVLTTAVRSAGQGVSAMVVLVGSSSTGKTRACWEAVQPLARKQWRLWHPFDPTRAESALEDLHRVEPRTVVWLNESQHYLGSPPLGEQIAAAIHSLLTEPARGPVLVLGTLWPEYERQYTTLPAPGGPDPHSRVRELLAGRTLIVPEAFDPTALAEATAFADAGDLLLADALARAGTHGRVSQDLAGAPQLLARYESGSPAARALLEAAMDARRLGVGLHLPHAFLINAATDYFTDTDYQQLTTDWAEAAFAELAGLVHGKQAPLHRVALRSQRRPPSAPPPPVMAPLQLPGQAYRLADFLEQHGRNTRQLLCPPSSFWHSAATHLTNPEDFAALAQAAQKRLRLQWAHHFHHRAARAGHSPTWTGLTDITDGGWAPEVLIPHGELDTGPDLARVNRLARSGYRARVEATLKEGAETGHAVSLYVLARMWERDGNSAGAEALISKAADAGYPSALYLKAKMRERAGDPGSAETLLQQAADAGHPNALSRLAAMRERAGDLASAETLLQQAADAGHPNALSRLAAMREPADAESQLEQAADAGDPSAMYSLEFWPDGLDADGTPTSPWECEACQFGLWPPERQYVAVTAGLE